MNTDQIEKLLLADVDIYNAFPFLEQRVDYFLYDWDDSTMFLTTQHLLKKVLRGNTHEQYKTLNTNQKSFKNSTLYATQYEDDPSIYPRAENLLKRIWAGKKYNLKKYPPQSINWNKDADPFFLYGPIRKLSPDLPWDFRLHSRDDSYELRPALKRPSVATVLGTYPSPRLSTSASISYPDDNNHFSRSRSDEYEETLCSYPLNDNLLLEASKKYECILTPLGTHPNSDARRKSQKLRFNGKVQQYIVLFDNENVDECLNKNKTSCVLRIPSGSTGSNHVLSCTGSPPQNSLECSHHSLDDLKLEKTSITNGFVQPSIHYPSQQENDAETKAFKGSQFEYQATSNKPSDASCLFNHCKVTEFASKLKDLGALHGDYSIHKKKHTMIIKFSPATLNDHRIKKREPSPEINTKRASLLRRIISRKYLFSLVWAESLIQLVKSPMQVSSKDAFLKSGTGTQYYSNTNCFEHSGINGNHIFGNSPDLFFGSSSLKSYHREHSNSFKYDFAPNSGDTNHFSTTWDVDQDSESQKISKTSIESKNQSAYTSSRTEVQSSTITSTLGHHKIMGQRLQDYRVSCSADQETSNREPEPLLKGNPKYPENGYNSNPLPLNSNVTNNKGILAPNCMTRKNGPNFLIDSGSFDQVPYFYELLHFEHAKDAIIHTQQKNQVTPSSQVLTHLKHILGSNLFLVHIITLTNSAKDKLKRVIEGLVWLATFFYNYHPI